MAVTLKMISERTGLSQAAVSQILNRKPNDLSSEETRKKVFAIAEELGYKQKFGHKLLRGDRTQTVAILIDMKRLGLEEHIQALVMQLLSLLEQKNYNAYLVPPEKSVEKNTGLIENLIGRGADCFIFLGDLGDSVELERLILERGRTFVAYGPGWSRRIVSDSSESTAEIIRYFLARGRRNFRFFLYMPPQKQRLAGFRRVFPDIPPEQLMKKYVVPLNWSEIADVDDFAEIGYRATRQAFEEDPAIDACFYLSDYFAAGGLRYMMEMNRKIGSDVLVAGFNNIHAIRNFPLPVSSAVHNIPLIASALVEEMTRTEPLERFIPTRTIIRE